MSLVSGLSDGAADARRPGRAVLRPLYSPRCRRSPRSTVCARTTPAGTGGSRRAVDTIRSAHVPSVRCVNPSTGTARTSHDVHVGRRMVIDTSRQFRSATPPSGSACAGGRFQPCALADPLDHCGCSRSLRDPHRELLATRVRWATNFGEVTTNENYRSLVGPLLVGLYGPRCQTNRPPCQRNAGSITTGARIARPWRHPGPVSPAGTG